MSIEMKADAVKMSGKDGAAMPATAKSIHSAQLTGGQVKAEFQSDAYVGSDSEGSGGNAFAAFGMEAQVGSDAKNSGGFVNHSLPGAAGYSASASADRFNFRGHHAIASTRHFVELYGKDGELKWSDAFDNLVVAAGLNKLLDAGFVSGLASPAWFIGLVDGAAIPAYDDADKMGVHSGWTEFVGLSDQTRVAYSPGQIVGGSVDNSASRAKFHITAP